MAGLLDDPTKPNPIAGALNTMGAQAFGTPTGAPQQAQAPVTAPDIGNPLPLPNPQPGPAPVPTPTPAPSPAPFVPDNRTIEDRVVGLIDRNSDYIRQAEARGSADAAKRGLRNSTMAEAAARGAAIDRALPIAQGDTDIAAQDRRLNVSVEAEKDRLKQAAGYDMERLQAGAANDLIRDAAQAKSAKELAAVQGTIQSALQSQGNTEQIQRMGIDLGNQLQLQDKQLQSDLAKIAASGNEDIRRLVEAGNQERVTLQQSIAAQDRQAMASSMVNIFQIEQQLRSALLSNDKIPAAERAAYENIITSLGAPIRDYIGKLFGPAEGAPAASGNGLLPPGTLPGTTGATETGGIAGSGFGGSPYAETGGVNPETASDQQLIALVNQGGVGGSTAQRILESRGVQWV